jgi:hypothetical protein
MYKKFWFPNLKERDQSEDLDIGGRIILEWTLGKYSRNVWTGFMWLIIEPVVGSCKYVNEHLGAIKIGDFLIR